MIFFFSLRLPVPSLVSIAAGQYKWTQKFSKLLSQACDMMRNRKSFRNYQEQWLVNTKCCNIVLCNVLPIPNLTNFLSAKSLSFQWQNSFWHCLLHQFVETNTKIFKNVPAHRFRRKKKRAFEVFWTFSSNFGRSQMN